MKAARTKKRGIVRLVCGFELDGVCGSSDPAECRPRRKVNVRTTSARVQIANTMNVARQPVARYRGAEVKNTSKTPTLPKALWNPMDFCNLGPPYDFEIVDIPTG